MLSCGGAFKQGQLADAAEPSEPPSSLGPIAVGARFKPKLDVGISGSETPSVRLVSARPEVLKVETGELVGVAPGMSAVLFVTDTGTVLDFTHLWVSRATRLKLLLHDDAQTTRPITGPFDLRVGQTLELSAELYNGEQALSGSSLMKWTVSSPAVALLRRGSGAYRHVLAREPGVAELSVRVGGLTQSLEIGVVP